MNTLIYRVQDEDGRGPFKPGFTDVWLKTRKTYPPTWIEEFGIEILQQVPPGYHAGSGCLQLSELRNWFRASEYRTLQAFGYQAVAMHVVHIHAVSSVQLLFSRELPLYKGVSSVDLY